MACLSLTARLDPDASRACIHFSLLLGLPKCVPSSLLLQKYSRAQQALPGLSGYIPHVGHRLAKQVRC